MENLRTSERLKGPIAAVAALAAYMAAQPAGAQEARRDIAQQTPGATLQMTADELAALSRDTGNLAGGVAVNLKNLDPNVKQMIISRGPQAVGTDIDELIDQLNSLKASLGMDVGPEKAEKGAAQY